MAIYDSAIAIQQKAVFGYNSISGKRQLELLSGMCFVDCPLGSSLAVALNTMDEDNI